MSWAIYSALQMGLQWSGSGTFSGMDDVGSLGWLAEGVAVELSVGVGVVSGRLGLQMGLQGSSGGRWEWKLWAICSWE